MSKNTQAQETKSIKEQATETFITSVEAITEVSTVAYSCVKHTPAIAARHAKKVSAEMDDIFAKLLA